METNYRAAAFFDVDRTLLPGASAEMLFVRALLRGQIPGRFRVLPFLAEWLRLLPKGITIARKANKAYLAGAAPEEVRRWGEELFAAQIEPRLHGRGRTWIERERNAGRAIVLLSGMPELLLEPFVLHFAADFRIGTPLEIDARGKLTGRRAGPHPYGRTKLEIAQKLAEEHQWDLSECSAYGDHASDVFLLASVGEAHAVDPDPRLRSEAAARGWPILEG
jgi:putative phosphoserine phosphatase/1-acylglycerol-3-phosphate O-acyltransferase